MHHALYDEGIRDRYAMPHEIQGDPSLACSNKPSHNMHREVGRNAPAMKIDAFNSRMYADGFCGTGPGLRPTQAGGQRLNEPEQAFALRDQEACHAAGANEHPESQPPAGWRG